MLYLLENGTIQLTRGDTARFAVTIKNDCTGEDYEIQPDDVLRLTLRKSVTDGQPAVEKVVTGANSFRLRPEDTKSLAFGRYLYDVELTTATGDVYTVIVPTTFEVLKEVSQ